jgi:hypothetical protein
VQLGRKTDEEKLAKAAAKEQQRRDENERRRLIEIERQREAFFRTPAGRARRAFERGDQVFQYSHDVMSQKAIVIPMVGAKNSATTTDPVDILNSVCREGWELVNGSFVFVEQGQESRDKFMASGQNVAIRGTTVGYYLFRRHEPSRASTPADPWLDGVDDVEEIDVLVCEKCGAEVDEDAATCPSCGEPFEDSPAGAAP